VQPEFSLEDYDASAAFIRNQTEFRPQLGMILGSGLGLLADQIEDATHIPYADIPHFPVSTVPGHAGRLVIGKLAGSAVCAMQGRFHFYEGYSPQQITFPIRVMKRLGVESLILTNAAGGLNPNFRAGDLMLIQDHLNLVGMSGYSPLRGPNLDAFGPRFPSMTAAYSRRLHKLARSVAKELGIGLRVGVYAMVAGPNFETPAEVRYLRGIGADAVGMSTVPEALVARHAGMEVLGISSITNIAVDRLDTSLETTHEEVLEVGKIIVPKLTDLLLGIVGRM
jgi:purine-nucleoside phosphorylase